MEWMFILASALMFASLGDFTLQSGKIIKDLRIAYRTYGTRNADSSNVILFPTWFNGTTEQLEKYLTEANPFADPSKYFIVSVDAIGNGVSTSPSNSKLQKRKAFPLFSIPDMVISQRKLLVETLGVTKLHAVVGISMGAMQAFEWVARYPSFMKKGVSIVGTPHMTGADLTLWIEMATKYASQSKGPEGDTTKNPGGIQTTILNGIAGVLGARGGNGAVSSIPSPDNMYYQFQAMVNHDATKHFGRSLAATAKGITAEMILFIADKDTAVSGDIPLAFAREKGCRTIHLTSPEGHNAYKVERELISREVLPFLDGLAPPVSPSIFY